ncbi:Aste57867_21636 [Aphanomyces stellatus]|uniref:Aste57867_21636 protein n=1 Tax=Aphanomyces stellatus TaxID=120398 RepID=A0A485LI17_9STRA|nr:hypothetical protein As57867_021567 [Aphanomyces stellatus]VFT98306.1 Aste57867_21636 [Aphanomyces stellatus]
MFGHRYFEQSGDSLGFQFVNGFVRSHGLGVVVTANAMHAIAMGKSLTAGARFVWIRTYLLGLYLDVPIETLNDEFDDAIAAFDSLPSQPCDAHYFDGKPWDIPGVVIPDTTKHALIGTYEPMASTSGTPFAMQMVVTVDGDDLMLQFGAYKRRLIATTRPLTYVWALEWNVMTWGVMAAKPESEHPRLWLTIGQAQAIEFVRTK